MGRAKRRVSSIADGFRNIEKRGRKGGNFPFLIIYLCSRNVHELIFLACLLSWLVYLELNRVWDILTGIRIAKDMSNFDLLKSGFASLTVNARVKLNVLWETNQANRIMKEIISLQLWKILILNKAPAVKPFPEKWEGKKKYKIKRKKLLNFLL